MDDHATKTGKARDGYPPLRVGAWVLGLLCLAYILSFVDRSLLNLLVEVSGEKKKDKAAKVATARNLWVPAVSNHGGVGRWAFVEISDPWDAEGTIRSAVRRGTEGVGGSS